MDGKGNTILNIKQNNFPQLSIIHVKYNRYKLILFDIEQILN